MCKVNFVSEFNSFMRYARDNSLSLRERMLWIALFYVANDRATYNEQSQEYDWPEGFYQVSNGELNLYCCLDKRAIETLRNGLKQRGLIDFRPGEKNKKNPSYRLFYFSANVWCKNVPNIAPNTTPNHVPNIAPNTAPNHVPNIAPSSSPLSKDNIDLGIDAEIEHGFDEDEEEAVFSRACEKARILSAQAYRQAFGEAPTPAELDSMGLLFANLHLQDIADKAIYEAAKAAPSNRLAYLQTLCHDWYGEYLRTPDDLEDYMTRYYLGKNVYPAGSEESARNVQAMLEAREERKRRYSA